jgi:hypothetical protein
MSRELKIFRITLMRSTRDPVAEHYAGTRFADCRQIDAVVAAATKKEATELFGISSSEANHYMSSMKANPNDNVSAKIALSKPGQVFAKPTNCWADEATHFEISREPHRVRPRIKSRSIIEIMAEREESEFTREELEAILERFAMANDSLGQSIAAKAQTKLS